MNALLAIKPRMAGDATREPSAEFPLYQGNLHYSGEGASRCPTTVDTYCTFVTLNCLGGTSICYSAE